MSMGVAVPVRVMVLGTDHSPQLVARSCRPAVLRAFLARVRADAICVECTPEAFARNAIPDFVYEARHVAVPFARERGTPLYPVDWMPRAEDQRLVWGVPDLLEPPLVRAAGGQADFLAFTDTAKFARGLFFAEESGCRGEIDAWQDQPRRAGEADFPRRLSLYRTYMQAMRVKAAAESHPGGTVLVMVGYMHKYDIERVLAGNPRIAVVQPSAAGAPSEEEVAAARRPEDDWAVASFNLLGLQAARGSVDWAWVGEVLARLEAEAPGAEATLLRVRHDVMRGRLRPGDAADRYRALAETEAADRPFTFDGVADRRRLDSYYDPFGNLLVRQRALLEAAREWYKSGASLTAEALRARLAGELSPRQAIQLHAYWAPYVERTR
jgi:hypothetical protein